MLYKNKYIIKPLNKQNSTELIDNINFFDDNIIVDFNVNGFTQTFILKSYEIEKIQQISISNKMEIEETPNDYGGYPLSNFRCS